jgi:hypothetical protein
VQSLKRESWSQEIAYKTKLPDANSVGEKSFIQVTFEFGSRKKPCTEPGGEKWVPLMESGVIVHSGDKRYIGAGIDDSQK